MTVLRPDELYTIPALSALVFVPTSAYLKCCRNRRCSGKLGETCVSCSTTFQLCHSISQYPPCLQRPRTEQQVPTVNKHPEGRTPDTINASGAEPVGVQVAVARVQPESSLQGTLESGEAATAGDSAGGAFRQADRKNAAGDRVNPSERTPIQFADKSNAQQVAPGREQVSPVDTAATHLADEQLKTTRARTSVGEHIDSARTDDAHLHGQDSGTEGLTMEAKVSFIRCLGMPHTLCALAQVETELL